MAERSVTAIVLRRRDAGESDRRLTILCPEEGRIEVIAKGARKGGSRLAGSSEPLTFSRMTIASGKALGYVTQVQPQSSFPGLRRDYERLNCALAWAELFEAVSTEGADAEALFSLLHAGLQILEHHENPTAAFCWLALRLLDLEGCQPSWATCLESGHRLKENPAWFSPGQGGYRGPAVSPGHGDWVSAEGLLTLEKLEPLDQPPPKMRYQRECLDILHLTWTEFAHKKLPTLKQLIDLMTAS